MGDSQDQAMSKVNAMAPDIFGQKKKPKQTDPKPAKKKKPKAKKPKNK